MNNTTAKSSISICDTQPITIEGFRALLRSCQDMELVGASTSILGGMETARNQGPAVVIIDKAFGLQAVMDWLMNLRSNGRSTQAVVWGVSMNEAEALRIIQAGAKGVIRKTTDLESLLTCLRAVLGGNTWMEDCLLQESDRTNRNGRSNLTAREQQVVELVEQGMKNKEIARTLGIRPGTVKIHLKHIFEKTGVRGRYGLALTGLREKGLLSLPAM